MSEKRYSEAEIKKIIHKATQMQNDDLNKDLKASEGFTLSELEKIGAEVGLNKEYLHAAATEFSHQRVKRISDVNATHIFEEREIEGEMTANSWDDLCTELRHYFGTKYGKIEEDPKRLEWTHMSIGGIETVVHVSAGNNHTHLRISQRTGLASSYTEGALFGFPIAAVGSAIVAALFNFSALALFGTFLSLFILFSILVFGLDVAWRKKKQQDLQKLADKITKVLYRNRYRDEKNKLKLETDLAEKSNRQNLSNILLDNAEESSKETDSNPPKNRNKLQ